MENNLSIGVPNDDSIDNKPTRRKIPTQYFDVKEGSNIYRPLPPFGELAESGVWAVKTVTHWGYKSSDGRPRNFQCLGKDCPECALRAKVQEELDGAADGSDVAELCEKFLYDHNLDIRHNLNVLSQDNKIGLLRLKTKMWQSFGVERQRLKKFGIHPASAEKGVWLNFNKVGKGSSGIFTVSAVNEETFENGSVTSRMKIQPLSSDVIKRMETEAFELNKLVRRLSVEEVNMLVSSVTDLQFDPEIVDSVFNVPVKNQMQFPPDSNEEISPLETPVKMQGKSLDDSTFEQYLKAGR
jgi:hypothetical protein